MYKLVWNANLLFKDYDTVSFTENDRIATFTNTVNFDSIALTGDVAELIRKQVATALAEYFDKNFDVKFKREDNVVS